MSLQLAAQHMASCGRGPDTQLVHMAPRELEGLQALAKAHGGSLTINPETGLAEAGFLKNILPMVIGGALAATGIGAPLAAAMVGGGYGLATGSLSKGLMAGLGAYGGAGLAGGLMGAGATGAAELGASVAPGTTGTTAAMSGGFGTGSTLAGTEAAGTALGADGTTSAMSGGFGGGSTLTGSAPINSAIQPQQAVINAAPQTVTQAPAFTSNLSQMGQGFKNLGTEAGREAFMGEAASKGVEATGIGGLRGLAQYGMAALSPMMFQEPEQQKEREKQKAYEYSYSPGRVVDPQAGYTGAFTGERTYFNPSFVRTAADGGLMSNGPVQSMSDQNEAQTLMANGGQMFAEGGDTGQEPATKSAVRRVEDDPYYTMTGQSGDAFKYLMGQGPRSAPVAAGPAVGIQSMAPPPASVAPAPVSYDLSRGEMVDDSNMKSYSFDPVTGAFTNMPAPQVYRPYPVAQTYEGGYAEGGIAALASGGQGHLGDYSDGGRFLRNADGGTTSDGISDSIPASIGGKRPARLAENEFVIPARIVSELGNGSSEAGARRLYAMMDRVQKARGKTIGKGKVAVDSKSEKYLPA